MHPSERLPDYALGLLEEAERLELERHLQGCASCRAELRRLSGALDRWVDSLATPPQSPDLWPAIGRRLKQTEEAPPSRHPLATPWWRTWLLAASLLVAAAGLGWGVWQQNLSRQLESEQQKVAGWLSRDDVRVLSLPEVDGRRVGSVLLLSDGRALFVLRDPPQAAYSYQAWGHRDGERVSLGVTEGTLLEVRYEGYDSVYLSLEPRGGSPQPTQPLGRVPVG